MRRWAPIIVLLLLTALLSTPMMVVEAGEIENVIYPPENLGRVPFGSIVELTFGADVSEAVQLMAIIDVNYSTVGFIPEGFVATMNGIDISDSFTMAVTDGRVLLNASSIEPSNGTLRITMFFRAGPTRGNYTFEWRSVYTAYQPPPNMPTIVDERGVSHVQVVFCVKMSLWEGWNLIGIPLNPEDPSIQGIFQGNLTKVQYIYGWDNENKTWKYWIRGLEEYATLNKLEPSKGYWVYVTDNFTQNIYINLPNITITPTGLPETIRIGNIVACTEDFEFAQNLVNGVIIPDLNEYARNLGYNVTFEFVTMDAEASADIHLQRVQELHDMGINLIIGGRWSSQAQASLEYINENNILLFSPSSTSPLLAIEGDNLFRMCPNDLAQGEAIAEMLRSWGIDAIIVIQRGDSWADGLYNVLEDEFTARGGTILARVRYATEVTEFSSYLEQMEEIAQEAVDEYGWEHVAVQCFCFSEIVTIITQAEDYPTLYNLTWFGCDGTAFVQQVIDDAPEQADKLKLLSTLAAPTYSGKWFDFYDRCYEATNQPASYYDGCTYDIAFVLAKAIFETQSLDPMRIKAVIPKICDDTFGVTGWCKLDEAGDRATANYDIWGYAIVNGTAYSVRYGYYDGATGTVTWFEHGITTDGRKAPGLTPPGHS